jgi:hypothetical protein
MFKPVNICVQAEVVALLAETMMAKLGKTKGFLIDGFPASLAQVESLVVNLSQEN